MRTVLLMVSVLGFAVLVACAASPGTTCTVPDNPACQVDASTLLKCFDGGYVVVSDCHGPGGCSTDGGTVTCDTTGNSAGDRCAPQSEGKVRCDPDAGANILQCAGGVLNVLQTCPASTSCVIISDGGSATLTCK